MSETQPHDIILPADLAGKHIHFMGIGGSGITTVVQLALLQGARCSGCEQSLSAATRWMERKGAIIIQGHSPDHVDDIDLLVISPAITKLNPDNPEVLAAQQRGIPVIEWQELLGAFMHGKCGISIAGVHGKGSTTAMASHILAAGGIDPTCEVGAIMPDWQGNVRLGKSRYFVNEADEFNLNFLHYHPRLALITSIEYEHAEFFPDFAAMLAAFEQFIKGMDMLGDWEMPPTLILNADSAGCRELAQRIESWPGRMITFGIDKPAEYIGYALRMQSETSFAVRTSDGTELGRFILQTPGRFNIENALGAIALAAQFGIDPTIIQQALAAFSGINRRFQTTQAANEITIIDDYADQPPKVSAVLTTARQLYPNRRIIVAFQINLFTRLLVFKDEFATVFGNADFVIIPDIHPGRERDTGVAHARDLVTALQHDTSFANRADHVQYGGTLAQTQAMLETIVQHGDVVMLIGAGNIYRVGDALMQSPAFAGYDPTLSHSVYVME